MTIIIICYLLWNRCLFILINISWLHLYVKMDLPIPDTPYASCHHQFLLISIPHWEMLFTFNCLSLPVAHMNNNLHLHFPPEAFVFNFQNVQPETSLFYEQTQLQFICLAFVSSQENQIIWMKRQCSQCFDIDVDFSLHFVLLKELQHSCNGWLGRKTCLIFGCVPI